MACIRETATQVKARKAAEAKAKEKLEESAGVSGADTTPVKDVEPEKTATKEEDVKTSDEPKEEDKPKGEEKKDKGAK